MSPGIVSYWPDAGHRAVPRISGGVWPWPDGLSWIGGKFPPGKSMRCCQPAEDRMLLSQWKRPASTATTGPYAPTGWRASSRFCSSLRAAPWVGSLAAPGLLTHALFLPTAADEDEWAGRLAEHHGALASKRLLAAHHAAAQHGAALPPARWARADCVRGGEGWGEMAGGGGLSSSPLLHARLVSPLPPRAWPLLRSHSPSLILYRSVLGGNCLKCRFLGPQPQRC